MAPSKPSNPSRKPFAALEPNIINVSETSVRKKWTKLQDGSQQKVNQLFRSVERSSRLRSGDSNKGLEAQAVVEDVTNLLTNKLRRMPVPPRTEDIYFDYESTLNRTRMLESQLTANIHSMLLLKAEIGKERAKLEQDRTEYHELEQGLKDAELMRRKQNKRLHPLARTANRVIKSATYGHEDLLNTKHVKTSFHSLDSDTSLRPVLKQLRSHLESMQNNIASIKDISDAMENSKAFLDVFASRSMDTEKHTRLYDIGLT